jgi:ABC-type amino acid transport substrate-binding protein
MKKIFALALALAMSLALFASCGETVSTTSPSASTAPAESAAKWRVISESLASEEYAIGFRKEDAALTKLVNDTLIEMKTDGSLAKISGDWFGKDITTIPSSSSDINYVADSADTSAERTTLILGLDASFPPMGYTDEGGNIVGFDVDVAKALCAKLGWELKLQPIDWDAKEMELNSGNIDCIWNGMTVTDERQAAMSLSLP